MTIADDVPIWEPCDGGCGEYYCNVHLMRACECPCPSIEEWAVNPYLTSVADYRAATPKDA